MANQFEVTCINKRSGRQNPHERIQYLGNCQGSQPWRMAEEAMIARIESGNETFYTRVNGRRVDIMVARHNGRKYLKTVDDGYEPNNLLALPECHSNCGVIQ